jgi:hypothetical protein
MPTSLRVEGFQENLFASGYHAQALIGAIAPKITRDE